MIGGRRPLAGRKPADRRVRVERPHSAFFRYAGPNQFVAKEAASLPTTASGRAWARLRAAVFGRPLAQEEEIGERLSKKLALPIFSSDAISSSTYASEEILFILTEEPTPKLAAAEVCRKLSAKFARFTDASVDGVSESASQKSEAFASTITRAPSFSSSRRGIPHSRVRVFSPHSDRCLPQRRDETVNASPGSRASASSTSATVSTACFRID